MKCQSLFSEENRKKNILVCHLLTQNAKHNIAESVFLTLNTLSAK